MILAAALLLQAAASPIVADPCPSEIIGAASIHDGIYVDDFEGQRFFEGARSLDGIDRRSKPSVWLSFDVVGLGAPFGIISRSPGRAYRIRFVGQSRSRGAEYTPCGYGHMDAFGAEIRMIRLLAIDPLPATSARP